MPELAKAFLKGNYSSAEEYRWYLKRTGRLDAVYQSVLRVTGAISMQTPVYDYLFYGSGLKDLYPVMEQMHVRNYLNSAHRNELENVYDNCMQMQDYRLPSGLHVMFLLDHDIRSAEYYGIDWTQAYRRMITNDEIQSVTEINGDPYVIFYNAPFLADKIKELIGSLSG